MPSLFQKSVPKGNETRASGADKKKLRQRVLARYPLLGASQLDELIPLSKNDDLRICKLGGKRDELYRAGPRGGQPVFFDLDCIGLIPTCYTLHRAPQILRQVFVYPGVAEKVCRGADLFLPGVVRPDDLEGTALATGTPWPHLVFGGPFAKDELCALVTAGGWAPFAVGRLALSSEDALDWGLAHGTCVEVLQYVGDALWQSGSGTAPAPGDDPPEAAAEALREHSERAEAAAAAAAAAVAARRALEAVAAEAEQVQGLVRRRRRVDKLLRQIEEAKVRLGDGGGGGGSGGGGSGGSASAAIAAMNSDQAAKLAKEAELRAEAAELDAELARLGEAASAAAAAEDKAAAAALAPGPDAAAADSWEELVEAPGGDAPGGATAKAGGETAGGESAGTLSGEAKGLQKTPVGDGGEDGERGSDLSREGSDAGEEGGGNNTEVPDAISAEGLLAAADWRFTSGFFAALSLEPLPALANVVFAKAAQLAGGFGIKQTSWRKAARFLEAFADCGVTTRESRPGVLEIVKFDAAAAPPLEPLPELAADGGEDDDGGGADEDAVAAAAASVRPTKKGGSVMVTERKVRGKNCTFVDGLDSWGIGKEGMQALAREYRRRFSAAASVSERKGTEGGRRVLWSVMLQGNYAERVALELRERGVTKVTVAAASKSRGGARKK